MFGFSLFPKDVSVQEAAEKLGAEGHLLLDVRTRGEVQMMGIKGALNIPLDRLEGSLDQLRGYSSIHIICQTGNRSSYATQMLHALGLTQAENVAGGIVTWVRAGLPTTRG
ncbi:MAG TPA: rhodanese-like domain-containing protein [Candidatus Paceibacterota bacterium]